jgi:hypothetical protein
MHAAASESDEYDFGTMKDHGLKSVLVYHFLTNLEVTVEREVQRKAIVKTAGAEAWR